MKKRVSIAIAYGAFIFAANAQIIKFEGRELEPVNVNASVVRLNGEQALKIERDMKALPLDFDNMISTVDEPTFLKLSDTDFSDGTIEVKVLSRLLPEAPPFARGFIGVAFRIGDDNSVFESIYIRPTNGRVEDQQRRNHTVQYFSYPGYKFAELRKPEYGGQYETYADIGLNEWITMRIEVVGSQAKLYLNDQQYPSFVVNSMLGKPTHGAVGLWVEVGTEGYFKDIKVSK
ncbi:hypothetical protein RT717_14620 [Imperialibacter roseus]|uniref:3-keto-alpha-glucoside-1,2-lyase/3-keto-2-hydroxy-glucal hydratase domain-containing protein n=1 Tax=Imperialibacter roseus TaxID=1324217 RepID=A0ABZ0IKL0_9BACT|nr:family 16 glycoside hydrolase [Imperialibacter roseus]WOK04311.1 hypothetical protein RT717_14620 [Imperialibacter roseus]